MTGETNSPDEVYIDVNGERWYRNVNISEDSGTYTHPYLLPEGKIQWPLAQDFTVKDREVPI